MADADLQILLSDAMAAMVDHVRYGKVDPASLDASWNVDNRIAAAPMETVLEQMAGAGSPRDFLEAQKPNHFIYVGLKAALQRYRELAAKGGWPVVPAGPTVKPGTSDARVPLVRQRLAASGELAAALANGSDVLDDTLSEAVKTFQEHHRLAADGVIGKTTIDALNVQVAVRIDQVRANLERIRWVVGGLRDSFVLVNLPAFKVYVIRDTKNVWETRTQIGKAGAADPVLPRRHAVHRLQPGLDGAADDPARGRAEADGAGLQRDQAKGADDRRSPGPSGRSVDDRLEEDQRLQLPLHVAPAARREQRPRAREVHVPQRALHLPARHAQPRTVRDRTCGRSARGASGSRRPLDLAAVLLESQEGWTAERIQHVVASGATETVYLKQPLPVVIVYWTVSVGASGELRFARDVYDRDAPLIRALDDPQGS